MSSSLLSDAALFSACATLEQELVLLKGMLRRNVSQHRGAKYYHALRQVFKAYQQRLCARDIPALVARSETLGSRVVGQGKSARAQASWLNECMAHARMLQLAQAACVEAVEALLKCSKLLAQQISATYFVALCTTFLACLARLYACTVPVAARLGAVLHTLLAIVEESPVAVLNLPAGALAAHRSMPSVTAMLEKLCPTLVAGVQGVARKGPGGGACGPAARAATAAGDERGESTVEGNGGEEREESTVEGKGRPRVLSSKPLLAGDYSSSGSDSDRDDGAASLFVPSTSSSSSYSKGGKMSSAVAEERGKTAAKSESEPRLFPAELAPSEDKKLPIMNKKKMKKKEKHMKKKEGSLKGASTAELGGSSSSLTTKTKKSKSKGKKKLRDAMDDIFSPLNKKSKKKAKNTHPPLLHVP